MAKHLHWAIENAFHMVVDATVAAQIGIHILHVPVKGAKHSAVIVLDPNFSQRIILHVKVVGHATVATQTTPKRHTNQITLVIKTPLVVNTGVAAI